VPDTFYAPAEDAVLSLRGGRPFNVIHLPSVLKFDLFPWHAFPLGGEELDRAVFLVFVYRVSSPCLGERERSSHD
jgi:hypothetical protein